ncbi:P-loop NTPase fold protein [Priestia megaterium]
MNSLERKEELKREIEIYTERINAIVHEGEEDSIEEYPIDERVHKSELDDLSETLSDLEHELREIDYMDEEKLRISEINNQIYKEGYILRDSESNNDLLSRTQHAHEISKLISNKKTLSPLTLGIYGEWGEGKSSFLKLIEGELEKINADIKVNDTTEKQYSRTYVVRFDASEYDDQDKIWFSMLSQLFAKYEEELGIRAKIKYSYSLLKKSYRENEWKYLVNAVIISVFVVWISIYSKDKSILEVLTNNAVYINILGLISSITFATNIIMPMLKKIKSSTKKMSEKIASQIKYPDYKDLLGTREKVKESLETLTNVWTRKKKDKIVVMVDELDRCSEKTIVQFFEALQLFLPIESLIFVISINQKAVCFALANNNLHFFDEEIVSNDEKLKFGQKYLEKYITIPYHLPYQKNYQSYINYLLTDNSGSQQFDIFSEKEKSILIKLITEVTKYKNITPREMKKIINLLLLSKERLISTNRSKEKGFKLRFEEEIPWFIIKYFYPDTADCIIKYLERHYKYNKYKEFKLVKQFIFLPKEYKDTPDAIQSKELYKYLDNIRIEYIVLSNRILDNLIR